MENHDLDDKFALGVQRVIEARGLKVAPLSRAAGLGVTAIRDLFRKGSSPKVSTAMALASALDMSIDDLIAIGSGHPIEGVAARPALPAVAADTLVPVFSVHASAGPGLLNGSEDIAEKLAFPPDYLRHITKSHPRNLAIISVKGDSMAPTLKDDDVVMIDTSKVDLSYEGIFVVKVDEGAALLVKRIGRASHRGFIMLISDNKSHPPVEVAAHDVIPVGKVVWAGVKV